jgi:hypothetical protein
MSGYALELTRMAEKDILRVPKNLRRRIDAEILALIERPRPDGVVKLKATSGGDL